VALTLQRIMAGGFAIVTLQNLRTEIVLIDTRDVAFWFSITFRMSWQPKTGKRVFPLTHQNRVRPSALFPKRREYGEKISFGEDQGAA
jgi:hypothetical protein